MLQLTTSSQGVVPGVERQWAPGQLARLACPPYMGDVPEPEQLWRGQSAIERGVRNHRRQLEDMFGDSGLARLRRRYPDHPAVRHYDLLAALERGEAVVGWPNESEAATAVGTLGLDFSTWVPSPPYDDFWGFLDAETRSWTVGARRKPDQFEDVMAELFVWGWLRRRGLNARRANEEAASDIVVANGRDSRCEVKRVHLGTSTDRVGGVVARKSKQADLRSLTPTELERSS